MASSGAIKAGAAYVELFADKSKLDSGLAAASRRLSSWGSSLAAVGGAVFAAGLAIDAAFDRMAYHFVDAAFEAGQVSLRTGIAVEEVTALGLAAQFAGGSAEELQHALLHMSRTIVEAAQGGAEAQRSILRLGLSVGQLAGMAPDAAFKQVAGALAKIPNAMQRASQAQDVFGRGVLEILPLLAQGSAGIEEFERRARELHLTISADDVKAAREFRGLMNELKGSLARVGYEVGKVALPALKSLREQVIPFLTETIEWVQANRGLVLSVTKIGVGLMGAGAGIVAVGFALKGLSVGLRGALGLLRLLPAAFSLVTSPTALLVGALGLGAYAFLKYTKAGRQASVDIAESMKDFKDDAVEAWDGVVDAVQSGDLELAGRIAMAGLDSAWVKGVNRLTLAWDAFGNFMSGLFLDLVSSGTPFSRFLIELDLSISKLLNKVGLLSDAELAKQTANTEILLNADPGALKKAGQAVKDRNFADLMHEQAGMAVEEAKLRDELKELREKARQERKGPREYPDQEPGAAPFVGMTRAETAGTFAGLAAGRLGGGTSDAALTRINTQLAAERLLAILDIWRGA